MDLAVLKKKISSYKTATGKLMKVPDDLTMEILYCWEQWTGPASGFYTEIGISSKKMARVIGRGKKLKRDGFGVEEFKEVHLMEAPALEALPEGSSNIELVWDNQRVIRFKDAQFLIDFLTRFDKQVKAA